VDLAVGAAGVAGVVTVAFYAACPVGAAVAGLCLAVGAAGAVRRARSDADHSS
jgi:hypothetical protein